MAEAAVTGFNFPNIDFSTGFQTSGGSTESRPAPVGFGSPISGVLLDLFGLPSFRREGLIRTGIEPRQIFQREVRAPEEFTSIDRAFEDLSPERQQAIKDRERRQRLERITTGAFSGQAFGPGADPFAEDAGFGAIGQLLAQTNPFGEDATTLGQEAFGRQRGLFGASASALEGLISGGGQPVDVSALIGRELTNLKEQFSTIGGLFGSDIQSAALRQGSELRVGAEEAARQRQLQALGLAPQVAQANLDFGGQLLGLGSAIERTATPGGRALDLLTQLAGLAPTGAVPQGNITTTVSESEQESKGFDPIGTLKNIF